MDIFSLGIVLFQKEFKIDFYDRLFKKELKNTAFRVYLKAWARNEEVQHQEQINNLLIEILEKRRYVESQFVKKIQKLISNDHKKAYEVQERFEINFTLYDFVFMLVAMLQVLYLYITE